MKKSGFTLIELMTVIAILLVASSVLTLAQGGADYGRGPETDPVGVAAAQAVSSRVSRVESNTNSWNQALANAADWTNKSALAVARATNVIITADAKTNTIIVEGGLLKSWTITE